MDSTIKERISALLEELRSWGHDEAQHTVQELAERFGLTSFVVHRIANAEGINIKSREDQEQGSLVDSGAETRPRNVADSNETAQNPEHRALDEYLSEMETWTWKKPD